MLLKQYSANESLLDVVLVMLPTYYTHNNDYVMVMHVQFEYQ